MARSFDVLTDSRASVVDVHTAFGTERYWRDRLQAYGGDSLILDSLTAAPDGTVEIATTQDLRRDILPGVLAKALPSGFQVLRWERWRPAQDGQVRGDVRITATGLSGSALGSADLTPTAGGSALRFAGTVAVRVPVLGGQIEKYIVAQIAKEMPGIGRFTEDWITTHG